LIRKPRREDLTPKFYSLFEFIAITLGIMLIPLMSYIPKQIRVNILFWGYKLTGGEIHKL